MEKKYIVKTLQTNCIRPYLLATPMQTCSTDHRPNQSHPAISEIPGAPWSNSIGLTVLTTGVIGHVGPHRERWAALRVHHARHVVHGRAIGGARAHHARGHVGVARHPEQ
jgi:hypothetical protein